MAVLEQLFQAKRKLIRDGQTPDQYLSGVLGESYDQYRSQWRASGENAPLPEFPLQLDFQLNNRCNFRCGICPWHEPESLPDWSQPVTEFPFEKFCEIVREGRKDGHLQVINFEGLNEPLLKKDLADYIAFASQQGVVDLTLHTNGLLLSKEWSERLIRSGLTRLMVSLDAFSPETFKKVRASTKYETIIRNIAQFLEIREQVGGALPIFRTAFVVQPANKHEKEAFVAFWNKYADYVLLQDMIDMTGIVENGAYGPGDADKTCAQPFYRMSVKANGDVFPCCCSLGHLGLVGGNVFKESIQSLWHSDAFNKVRHLLKARRYKEMEPCRVCLDNVYC